MKTAFIYLRVSTTAQAEKDLDPEGYSIPAQREACRAKADSLGAAVVAEFVDRGESARSADRPELQRMLRELKTSGGTDYVIVHKIDRLARNRFDDVMIGLEIRQAGSTLVSVSEPIDETPTGMLLHAVMSGFAEYYSRNLATEALKGLTQKAKSGGTPMKAPIGYRNVIRREAGREIRTVELDAERADLIRWAFTAYASGRHSLSKLLEALTKKGLTTRPTKMRPAHPLHQSHLNSLLRNPYYTGVVHYRGQRYEGRHEALITPALFEKVQRALDANYTAGERSQRHYHYLKGSLRCDICGSTFSLTQANGHGGTYLYFFCIGRAKYRRNCTQKYLRVEDVEALVERHYANLRFTPERAEAIARSLEDHLAKKTKSRDREREQQQRRLARLRSEATKLLQLAYKGTIADDILESELLRIKDETRAAEAAIAACDLTTDQVAAIGRAALERLINCERAYQDAPDEIRRQLNQAFFKAIHIGHGGNVRAEINEPFATMIEYDFMREFNHDWDRVQQEARALGLTLANQKNPTLTSSGRGSNFSYLVGGTGFEPVKAEPPDLQSGPFGRLGILPCPPGLPDERAEG